MDGRDILLRDFYPRRVDAIKKCAGAALRRGYRVFAVQNQGWCATGPRAQVTYRKYGRSNRCRNGKGGPWANDVYFVSGMSVHLRWTFPISSHAQFLFLSSQSCGTFRQATSSPFITFIVDLFLSKALFSLDPENLQLHNFLGSGTLFCCSFIFSLGHPTFKSVSSQTP